jgi:PAS domain S-box-containing protein
VQSASSQIVPHAWSAIRRWFDLAHPAEKEFELPFLEANTVKVLLIEDKKEDTEEIRSMLHSDGHSLFDLDCVSDVHGGLERAVRGPVDAVLIDLSLEGVRGLDAVNKLHSQRPELPIVVLAHPEDEELALTAVRNGAQDYLIKGEINATLLARATWHAIQQKQTEEALRHAAQEWRTTFDAIGSSVCLLDTNSIIQRCNKATTELLDRSFDQILGRNICELLHGEALRPDGCPLTQMLDSHERQTATVQVGEKWFGVAVDPMLDRDGRLTGVVHIMGDITDRKRMEAELEETRKEQLRTRDLFLSHVSHELRSPLAVTHMFVNIILDGLSGDVTNEQREYLEIILRNVEQLKSMIQELLEVTRVQTGKLLIEPLRVSLRSVIEETHASLKEIALSQNVELLVQMQSDLPDVYADPERIGQVLRNLVENGIKYMDGEGKVIIRAAIQDDDSGSVRVSVEDTGPGIEPEETERIFEQLYQGGDNMDIGRKGLGLGLYICRELVSRQGGRIWVESTPGKGSVFHFTVPVYSLRSLIEPAVAAEGSIPDRLTLFSITLRPPDGRELAKSEMNALNKLRASIESELDEDSDLLLPRLSSESTVSRLFILSKAEMDEIAGLTRQIRLQIDAAGELKERGYEYDLTLSEVGVPAGEDSQSAENTLDKIADNIQQLLENASGKEGAQ